MKRREAARLFSEICKCIPDASVSGMSLSPSTNSKEEFNLRINVSLDTQSFTTVESVVNRHGMTLKEDRGSLLIYRPKTKTSGMEITV